MTKLKKNTETPNCAKPMLGDCAGFQSDIYLMDCITLMKEYPDNYFDLAVVDPPYGINVNMNAGRKKDTKSKKRTVKKWDDEAPNFEYFLELFRVSKNQIIWGSNYFKDLPIVSIWIFWDKMVAKDCTFSDGELAWTSFGGALKKVIIPWSGFIGADGIRIHPTQKPIKLYDWIFKNYATEGMKILDTHLGSGSSRISANKANLHFTGCEIDKEYFDKSQKRYDDFVSQLRLF
jgi:site-specific DNA-methyltransferase (adenine-specific)